MRARRSDARAAGLRVLAAAGVSVAAVVGCSATEADAPAPSVTVTPEEPQSADDPSTPAGEEMTDEDSTTPAPAPAPEHPDPSETGAPLPTWDAVVTEEAQDQATAFMRAFARPDLSREDWYAGIAGFLSADAQEKYTTVDPRNIPATALTGEAVLADDSSVFLAVVEVPTDAGDFAVTLSRSEAGEDWTVERAEPVR